jgi:hypothetical protein
MPLLHQPQAIQTAEIDVSNVLNQDISKECDWHFPPLYTGRTTFTRDS